MADLLADDDAGRQAVAAHDERHVQRRVVEQHAVLGLAVVAEALAVVAGHHDQRRPAALWQAVQEVAGRPVGRGHLGVVGRVRIPLGEGLGRGVGRVRVVEVHPEQERAVRVRTRLQPAGRVARHLGAGPLEIGQRDRRAAGREAVVVLVEALREAVAPRQDHARHEGARDVAAVVQPLGQRHRLRAEDVAPVVARAVLRGELPRHDRHVGRERERDLGGRVREPDARGGQPVQVRRQARERRTVHPVGPERVDRDQDDVRRRPGGRRGRRRMPARGEGQREKGDRDPGAAGGGRTSPRPGSSSRSRAEHESLKRFFHGLPSRTTRRRYILHFPPNCPGWSTPRRPCSPCWRQLRPATHHAQRGGGETYALEDACRGRGLRPPAGAGGLCRPSRPGQANQHSDRYSRGLDRSRAARRDRDGHERHPDRRSPGGGQRLVGHLPVPEPAAWHLRGQGGPAGVHDHHARGRAVARRADDHD